MSGSMAGPFRIATLNVSQDGNDVRVRMTFNGVNQYMAALGIVQTQKDWVVDNDVTIKGEQLGLHVRDASVPAVADRLRGIGITTLPVAQPALVR